MTPNTPKMSPEQLDALLKLAGKKLGTTPENLKSQIENGAFTAAASNLSPQQSAMLSKALSDPKIAEKMLSSPQAQELYKKLSK